MYSVLSIRFLLLGFLGHFVPTVDVVDVSVFVVGIIQYTHNTRDGFDVSRRHSITIYIQMAGGDMSAYMVTSIAHLANGPVLGEP